MAASDLFTPALDQWHAVLADRHDQPAIFGTAGEVLRSFSDIENEAKRFRRQLGGYKGTAVVRVGNTPALPALLLACWQAGHAVCLIDRYVLTGIANEIAESLGAGFQVAQSAEEDLVFSLRNGPLIERSEACLYKTTSGTTGSSRLLGFRATSLIADCENVCETMGIGPNDVNYGVIAFTHSYGFSNLVTPLIFRGVPLVCASDALPRAIHAGLCATQASVLPLVPAMFRALLTVEAIPPSVRLCISAGAVLDADVARDFHAKFGRKIHSFYGASECGGICYDASEVPAEGVGFVGEALRGVRAEFEEGLLRVRSKALALEFETPGFQPADVLAQENRGFRIVGREADVINVAGRKVHPSEIEAVALTCNGVVEAIACGKDDSLRGQDIAMVVVGSVSIADLRAFCAARLPSWQVPRHFLVRGEIPRGSRGKVNRRELAAMFDNLPLFR